MAPPQALLLPSRLSDAGCTSAGVLTSEFDWPQPWTFSLGRCSPLKALRPLRRRRPRALSAGYPVPGSVILSVNMADMRAAARTVANSSRRGMYPLLSSVPGTQYTVPGTRSQAAKAREDCGTGAESTMRWAAEPSRVNKAHVRFVKAQAAAALESS